MNIKSLRAFQLTLSEGSLAGAAINLNLSQPAVSRLISSLENELKMTLFYRTGRRLKPTPEALAFYKEAGRIIDNLDQIPRIAADIKAGRQESIRIVVMPRVASTLVSQAISQFMAMNGKVRVSVDIQSRHDAYKWSSGREYDFGIGALPLEDADTRTQVLLRARAQVLIPKTHPLSKNKDVTAEDLINEKVIALSPGLLLRDQVDDFFHSAGLTPTYSCETSASMFACQLVADGAGVTILDALSSATINQEKVMLKPISPEKWLSFGFLFPQNHELSPSSLQLIDLLKKQAEKLATNDNTIRANLVHEDD